jgi:hypothetical protein
MKTENDGEESLEASPYLRCRSTRAAKIQPPGKERKLGRTEEGEGEDEERLREEGGGARKGVASSSSSRRPAETGEGVDLGLQRRRRGRCRGAGEGIRFRVASGRETGGGRRPSVIYASMNGGP